jgi:uncharacterized membrane protein
VAFVPVYGYMASAWAAFVCYFVMMIVSYYFGQKNMPIQYDLKKIGIYTLAALLLYGLSLLVTFNNNILSYVYKTGLLVLFVLLMLKLDLKDLIPTIKAKLGRK